MIKKISIGILLVVVIVIIGMQVDTFNNKNKKNDSEINKIEEKENNNMKAIIKTNKGDIEIMLNNETPNTVDNFVKLSEEGFYDGTKFHRIIKGFMIQGGDPLSKDDSMMDRWGTGGPGYNFDDEINDDNDNGIGSIAMANAGPNTNGSQFFINTANNDFLNQKHTVFGDVVSGMDVVTEIENSSTFPDDKPIEPIIIKTIEIVK